ncbi:hypothetical protein ACFVZ3_05195 [Kitasatospora purpeofusca]|uniref:hypothetical protein n=1 Tax=Kitasatospora purpeofusca TaxID=67352 RepID=UPI0036A46AA2
MRGPQVLLDGIALVGRAPSRLRAGPLTCADARDICLPCNYPGDLSSEEPGFFGRSQRADDILLTRPVLVGTCWADRITDRTETHLPRRSGRTGGNGRRRAAGGPAPFAVGAKGSGEPGRVPRGVLRRNPTRRDPRVRPGQGPRHRARPERVRT